MLVSVVGAAPYAYITNNHDNSVSVVDLSTNNVTAAIPVGVSPYGTAASPDGTQVYVGNIDSNSVSVIDTATNNVTATISVGAYPFGLAISPDGNKLYAANKDGNTVSMIDTSTNRVITTIKVGSQPRGIAVSPDGKKVYVGNYNSKTVSVINTSTKMVKSTIQLTGNPTYIACNPTGTTAYVSMGIYGVSVIDTTTDTVSTSFYTGGSPGVMVFNADGTKLYLSNGPSIAVIDPTKNSIISKIVDRSAINGISMSSDGNEIYTVHLNTNTVSVVNLTTCTIVKLIPVGDFPIGYGSFVTDIPIVPQVVAPVADFSANPAHGNAPLEVRFTDKSTGNPTSWKWDFGDGETNQYQTPIHIYENPGSYSVTLTVTNPVGNNTTTKTDYIQVN